MKQNLIDYATFEVKAGNGGNGRVSFLRNKQTRKGGPDGGDGGNGGSIWFEADRNISTLRFFAGKDRFRAESGEGGGGANRHGRNAEDMTIKVPVGTLIKIQETNTPTSPAKGGIRGAGKNQTITNDQYSKLETNSQTHDIFDLTENGQRALIAKGGKGGRGNKAFASSSNTTPKEAEPGEKGERKLLELELKVLADVGLIGLPNVGKSTLLSVLTKARPEIADYPFTTLAPNLGVMVLPSSRQGGTAGNRAVVLADNPGLIEEAHAGKGLGIAFLKHIERCGLLVHVLAPQLKFQDPNSNIQTNSNDQISKLIAEELYNDYLVVRKELGEFNKDLLEKPEIVILNKSDMIQDLKFKIQEYFKAKDINLIIISAVTHEGLDDLRQEIGRILEERQ